MNKPDSFEDLGRYYDTIMDHVDYDRWFLITTALAELMPEKFVHLDAACGTGVLLQMLRRGGWNSLGIDLSQAMLQAGHKKRDCPPMAAANLCALPFYESIDYITCLFDSINFVLEENQVRQVFRQFYQALREPGLLYFDVVTERMVTEFFEDQTWTEQTGRLHTTWSGSYDRKNKIADTLVRVSTSAETIIRERMYPVKFIQQCVEEAGFTLLGCYDAEFWRKINRKSTRIDFIAVKRSDKDLETAFNQVHKAVQKNVYGQN